MAAGGSATQHGTDGGAMAGGGIASSGGPTTRSGGATAAGGATGAGGATSAGGAAAAGGSGSKATYLPARIRRLTNAEYDASAQALLGTTKRPSGEFSFPPDSRQGPSNSPAGAAFTLNDAQRVDPVLASKLDQAAQALVTEARANGKLATLAPCTETGAAPESCATTFLRTFGAKAFRRPVLDEEVATLVSRAGSPYHLGANGHTYEEGIDVLVRVVLQTPAFLYVTELGDSPPGTSTQLTANEIASTLSYLLTSSPPDSALLAKAASGELLTPDGRDAEARRLIGTAAGKDRFIRVVQQWLGIEDVARREKAQSVYPEFASLSQSMESESRAFIEEVLFNSTGTLGELLTADWTIADAPLATLYGVAPAGGGRRTSLVGVPRRGILSQGAFLSVFATNNGSHPVFRGVAVMRRITCLDTPDPGALGIVVSFPASDAAKTTRARFEAHALDAGCAGCHRTIDALGFTLENFDGIGKFRTTENGLSVDSSVTVSTGADFDGPYRDSVELVMALARSPSVKVCLARQLFRSSAGRSDASVRGVEDAFVGIWQSLAAEKQDRLAEVLIAYVRSPLFIQRGPS